MKDLPPNPPVWKPAPERWFDRHVHAGDNRADIAKTLTAMFLIIHDRLRLPLPVKIRTFTLGEFEALQKFAKTHGNEQVVSLWANACDELDRRVEVEAAFKTLLFYRNQKT